ncbi:MAG: hypothetical protein ACJARX_001541 [Psychroserpens sp.]
MSSNHQSTFYIYKANNNAKNKLRSESVIGNPSKGVVRSLKRSLKQLEKEVKT